MTLMGNFSTLEVSFIPISWSLKAGAQAEPRDVRGGSADDEVTSPHAPPASSDRCVRRGPECISKAVSS